MIPITRLPPDLADPNLERDTRTLGPAIAERGAERLIERRDSLFRLHIIEAPGEETPCVVLPLDRLFEIRAAAALRLWRGLTGRSPGRDPAALPASRRERLVLALRALDGRLEKASYRDIAEALFGAGRMPERGWKTYDLRDRTVRLARLGHAMMQGAAIAACCSIPSAAGPDRAAFGGGVAISPPRDITIPLSAICPPP